MTQARAPSVRARNLEKIIQEKKSGIETDALTLAGALREMLDGKLYERIGYRTVQDYAEHLGYSVRTIQSLAAVDRALDRAGVDRGEALRIVGGMTKLSLLSAVMTRENMPALMALATRRTTRGLAAEIKKMREDAPSDVEWVTRSFRLTRPQARIVDQGIERAERECEGQGGPGRYLELIVADYLAGREK